MKNILIIILTLFSFSLTANAESTKDQPIRVLVITGGHSYNNETFNAMFASFGNTITYQVVEFPSAFEMFLP